jgi:hypothetical protein
VALRGLAREGRESIVALGVPDLVKTECSLGVGDGNREIQVIGAVLDELLKALACRLNVDSTPTPQVKKMSVAVDKRVVRADVDEGADMIAKEPVEKDILHVLGVRDTGDGANAFDLALRHERRRS